MNSTERIRPYFIQNRSIILLGFACLIIVDMLQLFIPRVIKRTVDDLTSLQIDARGLLAYALVLVSLGLAIGFFRYFWRRYLLGTSRRIEEGLRNELFSHLQTLSAGYFDKSKTGDLMAHATNDIQQISMATGMGMVALNDAVVLGAAAIGFMIFINVRLTLFVLIPMPFIVLGTRLFSKRMHHHYQKVQASFADLTECVRERFAGIRIIKAYGSERFEKAKIQARSEDYVRRNLQLVKITGAFFPMMILFSNLSLAIVLFLGGRQTILQEITPGDFVAFISYLGLLTWPMMALGWVTNLIQRGKASLDRIHAILSTAPEIKNSPTALPISRLDGAVRFHRVCFAYGEEKQRVLSDISFELAAGDTLGIIGPPGSGKTSLLKLILRFYDLQSGSIYIDGKELRSLRIETLRSHIAYVPQEPFMFAGTIRDNITLMDPSVKDTSIEKAAAMASVYQTIMSFPKQFDTLVGEKGVILSGGQKQRIALARALLSDRKILLLDDPISQVDTDTGHALIETIRALAGEKTVLIVSHRIAAIQFADTIISLHQGRIVEQGSHAALIANDRYYARTFQLQEIRYAS
ncbi:MAG: ABC transporter ATP-binding protein [Deltaproteobacteria bacterium]